MLGDAAYGNDTKFRDGITDLGLLYVCIRHPVIRNAVAAMAGTITQEEMERNGLSSHIITTQRTAPSPDRLRAGDESAGFRLEDTSFV